MSIKSRTAFSLVELLTVISLIALLSAILFPVFTQVREKARRTVCLSNMRQLGIAISMYAQDYDDIYPAAVDSPEHYLDLSNSPNPDTGHITPSQVALIRQMPVLKDITSPYIKSSALWHCPSDTGTDGYASYIYYNLDGDFIRIPLQPSAYQRLGTSYHYRTTLGLYGVHYPAECVYIPELPSPIWGSEKTVVMADLGWLWHGGRDVDGYSKWNLLFADGHAKYTGFFEEANYWDDCKPM